MNEELVFYWIYVLRFPWDKEGVVVVKLDKLGSITDDVKRAGNNVIKGRASKFQSRCLENLFLQKNWSTLIVAGNFIWG